MLQTPGGFELTLLVIVVGFVFFAIVAVGIVLLGGYVIYNGFFVDDPDVEGTREASTDTQQAERDREDTAETSASASDDDGAA